MDVFMFLKLTAQTPCDVSRQVPSFYKKGCGLIKQLKVNTWCLSCAQLVFLVLKGHTGSSPVLEVPGVQKLLSCCPRAEVLLPVKGRWDVFPCVRGGCGTIAPEVPVFGTRKTFSSGGDPQLGHEDLINCWIKVKI